MLSVKTRSYLSRVELLSNVTAILIGGEEMRRETKGESTRGCWRQTEVPQLPASGHLGLPAPVRGKEGFSPIDFRGVISRLVRLP